jgi:alpha-L-rhamnosidase
MSCRTKKRSFDSILGGKMITETGSKGDSASYWNAAFGNGNALMFAHTGLLISLCAILSAADNESSPLHAEYLRCEYRVAPIGIDQTAPRLSWIVKSDQRAQRQSAYQILVASSPELLAADHGDLWDSGKVPSAETTGVAYCGKPLASHQSCHWKVRVWDQDEQRSPWSDPSLWTIGLLQTQDWKAQWIGYDKPRQSVTIAEAPFGDAQWIWYHGDPKLNAPVGPRVFMSSFELPEEVEIDTADLLVAADDSFHFNVNGQAVGSSSSWQEPRLYKIGGLLHGGENHLRAQVDNASAGPAGLLVRLQITTTDGKQITHVSDASWRATDSPGANWHNREIARDAWPPVAVIGAYGCDPWQKLKYAGLVLPPASYLRKAFQVDKPVKKALIYVTALGICDVYVNGKRVSEDLFNPGWTDYTQRVYYRGYDVTDQLDAGGNAVGAILADGWFSGYIGWKYVRNHYGDYSRVGMQLQIEYEDGTSETIATGPDWRAATGPVLEADFLMGETYDARLEVPDWCHPNFDDSPWDRVDVGADVHPSIAAHPGPPVGVFERLHPKSITEPQPHVYVLDMGQNFAGVMRLQVEGQPGQEIQLRFAERLNPDGTIYTTNLRDARCIDTYICRGTGVETWTPRFTFHGFQYVEVTGLDQQPEMGSLVGLAISSMTPDAGKFSCSEPMLNQLHNNIYWTQRANFIDIPTDCPQRDERLGWTGDAQVYVRTASLNTDVQAFFRKWLVDLEDGQREDGQFPCVAPVKVAPDDGGPAWADAGVICPWTIYDVYADRRQLADHYDAMKRFIAFCENRCTDELLPPAEFHCFGDWLSVNADTPKDVIFMAYFAYSAQLTARAAEALDLPNDAAKYAQLFERIKQSFNHAYVSDDGRIQGNTQTCYVLALAFDLLDQEKSRLAGQYLVEDIQSRDWHLSTGFIGTKDLMLVLAKIGRNDVANRLLLNETYPSWGFSIRHGATSIWERWDGWTPEKGFQTPAMNSFAHYSFGAVYQWMVENLGGIRNATPGYGKIVIAPDLNSPLRWAQVDYQSIRGLIQCHWRKTDARCVLEVVIPANTRAEIQLPASAADQIQESGQPLLQAEAVANIRLKEGRVVADIGSGSYRFVIQQPFE